MEDLRGCELYRVVPEPSGGYSVSAVCGLGEKAGGRAPSLKQNRFQIRICSIKELFLIAKQVRLHHAAAILCSSYPINQEKVKQIPHAICLSFDDIVDETRDRAFDLDKAEHIRCFLETLDPSVQALYICCDSGESRSAAIAAAIMRHFGMNENCVWENPHYHPNPLVYRLMCKAFGIFQPKFLVLQKVRKNRKALRMMRK